MQSLGENFCIVNICTLQVSVVFGLRDRRGTTLFLLSFEFLMFRGYFFLFPRESTILLLLTYTSLNGGRSHCSRRYRLPAGNCPCFRCDTKGFAQLGCGEARSIEPKEPDQPECCSALDGEGGEGGQGKDD
jgi:hypothetical protein